MSTNYTNTKDADIENAVARFERLLVVCNEQVHRIADRFLDREDGPHLLLAISQLLNSMAQNQRDAGNATGLAIIPPQLAATIYLAMQGKTPTGPVRHCLFSPYVRKSGGVIEFHLCRIYY